MSVRGVTLVELLVAALLMTMLVASANECLRGSARRSARSREGPASNSRAAAEKLASDLRSACLVTGDPNSLFVIRREGAFDRIDFVRADGIADEPTFTEIGYAVRINQAGSFDLWRRTGNSGESALVHDVTAFEALALENGAWRPEWGWDGASRRPLRGTRGLPAAVSIRIASGRGDRARDVRRICPVYTALLERALHG